MKLRLLFNLFNNYSFLLVLCSLSQIGFAQNKKMSPEVYKIWRSIEDVTISNNGEFVAYVLTTEVGDPVLKLFDVTKNKDLTFDRGSIPVFDYHNGFISFKISPPHDSIRQKKLAGIKKDKLPGDTLGIYDLKNQTLSKIPNMKSFISPEKWGNYVAILLDDSDEKDKKAGSTLLFKNLLNNRTDTFPGVMDMTFPKKQEGLVISSDGKDSTINKGLHIYDFQESRFKDYFLSKGDFHQLSFSEDGSQLAFIADLDTSKMEIRPYELYLANYPEPPMLVADETSAALPEGMQISTFRKPSWSDDNETMYFGISPIPHMVDSTILDEEKPEVEVWTTEDPVLYTVQESRKKNDLKKNHLMSAKLTKGSSTDYKINQLESEEADKVSLPEYGAYQNLLAIGNRLYLKEETWKGHDYNDLYIIDDLTGEKKLIKKKINGNVSLSPAGEYAYWFDRASQEYYTLNLTTQVETEATKDVKTPLGDELNDAPAAADNYGIAGWSENDHYLIVYDRYDLWKIDPKGIEPSINLTNGRDEKLVSRYIVLDREADFIDMNQKMLLQIFDEENKYSGYAYLHPDKRIDQLFLEPFSYSRRVWKAENSDNLVFTKESFDVFPDLILSNTSFSKQLKISNANPQQSEYRWGSGKLFTWKDSLGHNMTGMLFTPDDFDPTRKYPLIINFYEKSSDGLYRYRGPYAGRSTISYSYYLNQGYVLFNPDVPYEIGYPGKSALNAVMSGLDALVSAGFIDEKRVGIQGHSWGGYQIAHILTKTNRFACAEAGAPVVNMTSAYGGIRWGSGMSRMFQYEKTQSRLGHTLWDRPDLYLENSPLFEIDKVETPVLILHNDGDTAVPWYQGIEYYMALRRLGKKGWFLNYNGEPHWPVKWPNRLDFQTRMEQFFAHYLLDAPMPEWMEKGISDLDKGKKLGY